MAGLAHLNMPRCQKIYRTRESIVKDIDAEIRRMKRLREKALDCDEAAGVLLTLVNSVQYNKEKDAADKLWAQAGRIETTRLKKLGATLAMWDTMPFAETPEEQVVLQKV